MTLTLFNTLSRKQEIFQPLNSNLVGMYTCGPTVYNYSHIGNWRTFLIADLLYRTLKYNNLNVKHVMNITDVDDKTIAASRHHNESLLVFTKKYEEVFLNDLASLNIIEPNIVRATDYISEMITLIEQLIKAGFAYVGTDGVYFSVADFPAYGHFRKSTTSDLPIAENESVRERESEQNKRDKRDFALWKFYRSEDGSVRWEASFGAGRPGWHIECSAMSMKTLGPKFDIHTGGSDLIFPHHENELAQSQAITGQLLAKYWIHSEFVNIEQEKMSKSLNNFLILEDLRKRDFSPLVYRYWVLTGHYRTLVNFTWQSMISAQTALQKLHQFFLDLQLNYPDGQLDKNYKNKFLEAVNTDLNLPQALAITWELVKNPDIEPANKKTTLLDFDQILGLGLAKLKAVETPPEITELAHRREVARQAKDWLLADQIRQEIENKGFSIKDTDSGPKIQKI